MLSDTMVIILAVMSLKHRGEQNASQPSPPLHSFLYRGFSKLGALSKRGRLSSFDSEADGIVPGEAVCAVLLNNDFNGALAEVDHP